MKLTLQVSFTDGTNKDIEATTPVMVAFEDKFNVSVATLGADTRISWLLYLAWHADKRTGGTKLSYEKWLETVDGMGETEQAPK